MADRNQLTIQGEWTEKQKILVILAHPDDPEFFCGGTLARWAREKHQIIYLLLTQGEKGGDLESNPKRLKEIRSIEQNNAAAIIGANKVYLLDLEDGFVVNNSKLQKQIVRFIRQEKPDILVTCDPTMLYNRMGRLNHPDHRATGQAVLDAVFPASGNGLYYPDLIEKENLQPYTPREIWISLPASPTIAMDITDTLNIKIKALMEHKSQIGDPVEFERRMRFRHTEDSTDTIPKYEEYFRVQKLR